jgi:hypothetical protein
VFIIAGSNRRQYNCPGVLSAYKRRKLPKAALNSGYAPIDASDMCADENLPAFVELERAIHKFALSFMS